VKALNALPIKFSSDFAKEATFYLDKIMKWGQNLIKWLKADFKIEGQTIRFIYPERLQAWSIAFTCKKNILGKGHKKFLIPVKNITLVALPMLTDITEKAIKILPDKGFIINYKSLQPDMLYILKIQSEIENPKLLDIIIDARSKLDDPNREVRRYWMHAQLKFLSALEKYFSSFKIEDWEFKVDVGVYEDIKISLPKEFERELEVILEWVKEKDRERKQKLSWAHLRIIKGRKRKDILKILKDLQRIFLPSNFRRFIDVKKDFRYHDCIRGVDYYNFPFPTWPRFMTVISRTDLTLEKPAAVGLLEFKRSEFRKNVENIFCRKKK